MNNILIIGCGLLGSSLLRRIHKKKLAKKIFVYEKSKKNKLKIKKLSLPGIIINRLADAVTESSSSTMNSTGINPVRQSGRYFRANVRVPSGTVFNHGQGIDITAVKSGLR